MPARIVQLKILILSILVIPLLSCSADSSLQLQQHSIVVKELTGDIERSSAIISGVAKNTGNRTINNCAIIAEFYDSTGVIIATVTEECPSLEQGGVWNFKLQLNGKDAWKVTRYEIITRDK